MRKTVNIGDRFGRLVVQSTRSTKHSRVADCVCDCGKTTSVTFSNLGRKTKSCGCLHRAIVTTHGISKSNKRLYYIWHNMVNRCTNEDHAAYADYGGRGITVCEEWFDVRVFRNWAWATGYRDDLTIDRRDNEQGYSPDNCRWVPLAEQSGNRQNRQVYTAWGESKSVSEWLKDERCRANNRRTIRNRVFTLGWAHQKALETPVA